MKYTPLSNIHAELGARMADFAGYNMPIVYTTISEEHQKVRDGVGVFDVSHMGEFILKGEKAIDLIQAISTNDASTMEIGDAQYTCMPNETGGIIDDMIIYRLPEDRCAEGEKVFMLVVNASNIGKDWEWIRSQNKYDVKMANISDEAGLLAVQGPQAMEVLQKLTDVDLSKIKYYKFRKGSISDIENVIISATGYTGSGGFELYVSNKDLEKLWNNVMKAGADNDIKPVGLGARDTLRLEMGFCLYGSDISEFTSPLEAGLKWITKLDKENDFPSKDIFKQQVEEGTTRRLVGFEVKDRRVPRPGYIIRDAEGKDIGIVTSGSMAPSLEIPIGMGYVKKKFGKRGTEIQIDTGKKLLNAEVRKMPFYKKD